MSQLSSGAQGAISVLLCLSTLKAFCNCPMLELVPTFMPSILSPLTISGEEGTYMLSAYGVLDLEWRHQEMQGQTWNPVRVELGGG